MKIFILYKYLVIGHEFVYIDSNTLKTVKRDHQYDTLGTE